MAALIPVLSWALLNATAGVLITVPVGKRLYVLPAILMPGTVSFMTIQHLQSPPGLSELWGTVTLVSLIHVSSLLYIKRWTLRIIQKTRESSRDPNKAPNRRSWTYMYRVALNPRYIRVPYKHVILPDQCPGGQVKSTARHGKFSLSRILWLLVKIAIYLLLNSFVFIRLPGLLSMSDITAAKAVLLRRLLPSSVYHSAYPISTREIATRLWVTMNTIWSPILLLDGLHTALAFLFIHIFRIDIPEDWPDLFGCPGEAFTLGRFWSM